MDHTQPLSFWERGGPVPPFLRLSTVLLITGLSRSTIYRMIAEHTFPAPVKIGKRAVAWRQEEVRQWCESRPSASFQARVSNRQARDLPIAGGRAPVERRPSPASAQ